MEPSNFEILQGLRDKLHLETTSNPVLQLRDGCVPVVDVIPFCNILRSQSSGSTGALTIMTAPSDKQLYLTAMTLTYASNAACDMATGLLGIQVTTDGWTRYVLSCAVITLTASNQTVSISFPQPLKVDKGTSITISGTFTAGVCFRNGSVVGFVV